MVGASAFLALSPLPSSIGRAPSANYSRPGVPRPPDPSHVVSAIHVVYPARGLPYIANGSGDEILLRGVDTNALVQYSDQPGCSYQETVPLHKVDLEEMGALGFDFLRLAVSWSRLEPEPGVFSSTYLDEISRVVKEAGSLGIAVLVDMHQDRYNRHVWCGQEVDGAPDWATLTYGTPCVPVEISTFCAQVATQAFWSDVKVDGKGLQSWYLGALEVLASKLASAPNLAGIELMNEPTPGLVGPEAFEITELYPFYRRMIAGLVRTGYTKPIWFEPSSLRDVTDNAMAAAVRFSGYSQLVYAVHIYTGVFSYPQGPDNTEAQLRQSYEAAKAEAASFNTPWVDDEFGSNASAAWDVWLRRELALQNAYVVGSGFWLWKQQPGFYGWSVVQPDGSLRNSTLRAQLLSLPHPDAVPGELLSTRLVGAGRRGAIPEHPSELRFRIYSPHGGTATVWSGTVVTAGGPSLIEAPFTSALVNGKPQKTSCKSVTFASPRQEGSEGGGGSVSSESEVGLSGCLVALRLPPGADTVVLEPA